MTDIELRHKLQKPRSKLNLILIWLGVLAAGALMLSLFFFDSFGLFSGTPKVREAKQGIAGSICVIFIPALAGLWLMVIRGLRTGVASGYSKARGGYIVLRSEDPSSFRGVIGKNIVIVAGALIIGVYVLVGGIRDLHKAQTEMTHKKSEPSASQSSP